jgi:hypothetical protein
MRNSIYCEEDGILIEDAGSLVDGCEAWDKVAEEEE